MILALDISTNLGWAAGAPGVPFVSGTMVFSPTGSDIGRLHYAVRAALYKKLEENLIEQVVAEAPIHVPNNSVASIEITFGMHATIALACKDRGLPFRRQPIDKVRSTILNYCRAPASVRGQARRREWIKARVVGYCIARGWQPKDDNAADALFNLEYRCRQIDPTYAAASAVEEMARGVA